ncbi:MAG: OmpA family protein [Chitinophagales bacterium]|nr:OmpA family protein [Chitinophagales bacterium]
MRYCFILLMACCVSLAAYAQEQKEYDWKTNLRIADDLYSRNSFYNAADYYQKVLKVKPDNVDYLFKLAQSQRMYRDYFNAAENYKHLLELDAKKFPDARYYYALMLKQTGRCDEAAPQFDQYLASEKVNPAFAQRAQIEKQGCDLAKTLKSNPDVKVRHLDNKVNSYGPDFAPFPLSADELVYASIKTDTPILITDTAKFWNAAALSRLYLAKQNGDTWNESTLLPDFINDSLNAANGSFSPDRSLFFFSKCSYDKLLNVHCDLFVSRYHNGVFEAPIKLPPQINNGQVSNTQPSVGMDADDNLFLYFSSDRQGGKGGKDIWVAAFDENLAFKSPVNAGTAINTSEDEVYPFFDSQEQLLYFSSNGKPSIGGFDIFKAAYNNGQAKEAENLGLPYNSFADDLGYTFGNDRQTGYFASNRPGALSLRSESTSEDVFSFKVKKVVLYNNFAYQTGDTNQTPLAGVKLAVSVKNPKTGKYEAASDFVPQAADDNNWLLNLKGNSDYKIVASKDKYLTDTKYVSAQDIEAAQGRQELVFALERINKDKVYTLQNIYYDYKSANLRDSSKAVLDTLLLLLENNPNIVIELSSHTDSRGGTEYNQKLSQERAESCVNYLISKGITTNRMVAKGYGEEKLLNNCGDAAKCTEEQHQVNRRTEFKVIGETEEGTIIK